MMRVSEILERFQVGQIGLQPCNALEVKSLNFTPGVLSNLAFVKVFVMFRNT